jgi:hypothetical protein
MYTLTTPNGGNDLRLEQGLGTVATGGRHGAGRPQCRLAQSGQKLDVVTANVEVPHWLAEIANARLHGTTKEPPAAALKREVEHLQALPAPWRADIAAARRRPQQRHLSPHGPR